MIGFDLEVIEWEDHCGGDKGWTSIEEIQKEYDDIATIVHSAGWVIREGERTLTLVHNFAPHGSNNDAQGVMEMTILKSCIISRAKITFED